MVLDHRRLRSSSCLSRRGCYSLICLLPHLGGAPVSGPPSSDPWAPAPAFSDPWGGSPAKPSSNGTAGTGGWGMSAEPSGPRGWRGWGRAPRQVLSRTSWPPQQSGALTQSLMSSQTSTDFALPCRPLGAARVSHPLLTPGSPHAWFFPVPAWHRVPAAVLEGVGGMR